MTRAAQLIVCATLSVSLSGSGAVSDVARATSALAGAPSFSSVNNMGTLNDTVVPFETPVPPESGYHHSTFDDRINNSVRGSGSEADWALSQTESSYVNRPEVSLEIEDPLFDTSKDSIANAHSIAGHLFSGGADYCAPTTTSASISTVEICEIFPVPEPIQCERRLEIDVVPIENYFCSGETFFGATENYCQPLIDSGVCTETSSLCTQQGFPSGCWEWEAEYSCQGFTGTLDTTQGRTELLYSSHTESERIVDECEPLQADPRCEYETVIYNEPGGTKTINGIPIYRDWWRTEFQYQCNFGTNLQNECSQYANNPNCNLETQDCLDDNCYHRSQSYRCTLPGEELTTTTCSTTPVCINGTCLSPPVETDSDFALAASWLNVLDGMAKDVAALNSNDPNAVRFFSGEPGSCTKMIGRNCCNVDGVLRDVIPCSQSQKDLAVKREALHTVFVGTHCAQKILGTCVRTKSQFCSFETKFSRVFQEQVRRQQGRTFGLSEYPDCSGLTITDLIGADLNSLDLSELFGDALTEVSVPIQSDIIDFMSDALGVEN